MVEAKNIEIGQYVEGQGVYLGYHPICYDNGDPVLDKSGEKINHHFFAGPKDLEKQCGQRAHFDFNTAVKEIAGLKAHYGADGREFADNDDFVQKLLAGDYEGEWRAAPKDILGKMCDLRDVGDLRDSFEAFEDVTRSSGWYGSSSLQKGEQATLWQQTADGQHKKWYPASTCANGMYAAWRPIRSTPNL